MIRRVVHIGEASLAYFVEKSQRKTAAIHLSAEGQVVLKVPLRTPDKVLDEMIIGKYPWIVKKQKELHTKRLHKERTQTAMEGQFLYLGKTYTREALLGLVNDNGNPAQDTDQRILNWYLIQAMDLFDERMKVLSPLVGAYPKKVTLKDQRSRWGSCSIRGNINLNWRLIMAPQEVIDYVIIHELCHMHHMDHSRAFWHLVGKYAPNYKLAKKWLKLHGHLLMGLFTGSQKV